MSKAPGEPYLISYTGRSATVGEHPVAPVYTGDKPSPIARALKSIGNLFMGLLPDKGGKSTTTDTGLISKTSPVLYEYEIFRQEWDRRTILREVGRMVDEDPRIAQANEDFAAEALGNGMTVTVTSKISDTLAAEGQAVIDQLLRDCQINSKLESWGRITLRDSDLFLNPVIDVATNRIKNIKSLPAISMQRNEDITGDFPDLNAAFRQIDPINLEIITDFPLWSVNHIRWRHEEGERYGKSQYLQLRGYWKKLNMTEEDLVVRRRARATPRRLHTVGNKEFPGTYADINEYMAQNKITAKTASFITDFFGNGLTDIKDLNGDANVDHIKDVEHLQEVYAIGTGVPLHMLGFGRNVNRDIVEDQIKAYKKRCQKLRNLMEYGDSNPYSGLRFIFDFALWLQNIDPAMVDYNVAWYAEDNETPSDRVDRVIKLRATQPKPLVSQKTALQILAKDLNLENATAIDAELAEIEAELALDKADQATLETELNPEKPATRPEDTKTATNLTDSVGRKKKAHPLRTAKAVAIADRIKREVKRQFREVLQAARPALANIGQKHAHFAGDRAHQEPLIQETLDALATVMTEQHEARKNALLPLHHLAARYGVDFARVDAASHGRKAVTDNVKKALTAPVVTPDRFVNPATARYLEEQAGKRITRIDESTLRFVRRQLNRAYAENETWPNWVDRIESVVDCSYPKGRGGMIAVTELSFGYNSGALATYAEIGVENVQRLEVVDNRTCPACADADGRTYTLADADGVLPAHPRCRGTWVSAA